MPETEQITTIQDFSLGLNTLTPPNRQDPRFSPTCQNVWYDTQALTKRNGSALTASQTGYGSTWQGISIFPFTISGASTFNLLIQLRVFLGDGSTVAAANPLAVFSGVDVGPIKIDGTSGTIATTAGSAVITGTSTAFTTDFEVGDIFYTTTEYLKVSSVDSNTQMTATTTAAFTNSGIATYKAYPAWGSDFVISVVSMNSKIWVCGKGSTAISYDGTTTARVAAFPRASFSLINKNYVFAANTAANPSRVSWSALTDPTTWPATNFVDVSPADGWPIVGMFYDGQSIIILKTTSAYKLTGDVFDPANATYTLTQLYTPSDFRCGTARSVQLFNGSYVILGTLGMYRYSGGGDIQYAKESDAIRADWAAISGTAFANNAVNTQEPKSVIYNGNYMLAVQSTLFTSNSNQKNAIYIWDRNGSFWRHVPTLAGRVSDLTLYNNTLTGVNSDMTVASASRGLMTLDTTSSDIGSAAINGTWTSKVFEFGNQQRFGQVYVYMKKQSAGSLVFEYSIDEGSFTSVNKNMTDEPGTRMKSAPILVGRVGRSIQFRLSNNVAAQPFEIYGIELHHIELRR